MKSQTIYLLLQKEMSLTGTKDVDIKILSELPVRDLLIFCNASRDRHTHRLCNDENMWKTRFITDYGDYEASFKDQDRSWKQYYLLVLRYAEDYENFRAVIKAIEKGYLDVANVFSLRIVPDGDWHQWNKIFPAALRAAAKNHDMKAIELLEELGLNFDIRAGEGRNYDAGLEGASEGYHHDLIEFFLEKGADPASGLKGAVRGGHRDLYKYFRGMGDNFVFPPTTSSLVIAAAQGGHKDMIDLLISPRDEENFIEDILQGVGLGGQEELAEYYIKLYPRWYTLLWYAAMGGHKKLVKKALAGADARGYQNKERLGTIIGFVRTTGYKDIDRYLTEIYNQMEDDGF